MKIISVSKSVRRCRRLAVRFARDKRGLAAVEFAFIIPLMLTLIFGTIEVSSGVAINRKVTLVARTLSDLVSQGTKVSSTDISNFFKLGGAIMTPYSVTPATMTQYVSALDIDASKKVTVVWSYKGVVDAGAATVSKEDATKVVASIPAGLLVPNTQLIWSRVTYTYTPIIGYVVSGALPMADECYTRPRQSDKVIGPTS